MRLSLRDLRVERGGRTIVDDVTASASNGEALIVTGPNGSGKSTLLRVICGLLPAVEGVVEIMADAEDAKSRTSEAEETASVAAHCHYLGHQNAMKTALSVSENLDFWRVYCGRDGLSTNEALSELDLDGLGHLPFAVLSTGQKRRAAIARLLVSRRKIWLLDEPTAGLDAASEARFADLMRAHLREGGIIVAATHQPLGLEGAKVLDLGGMGKKEGSEA